MPHLCFSYACSRGGKSRRESVLDYWLKENTVEGLLWPKAVAETNLKMSKTLQGYYNGMKVLVRRNGGDPFEFDMIVTGATYDRDQNEWDYCLKENTTKGLPWPKAVAGTNFKNSR